MGGTSRCSKRALGGRLFPVLLVWVLIPSWTYSQKVFSVASQSAAPGSSVTVAVQLSDGSGIAGLQFVLNYDSALLSYPAGVSPTPGTLIDGHSIVANGNTPGKVSIALASTNSLKSGSGSVVLIPLTVSSQAASGTQTSLTLLSVSAFDPSGGNVPLQVQGGTLTITGTSTSPKLSVSSTSLAFGSVQINNSKDLTFTVTNSGGETLTGTITSPVAPFNIILGGGSFGLVAGQSQTVGVRFRPTNSGSFSSSVSISSNGGNANVSFSGTGTAIGGKSLAVDDTTGAAGSQVSVRVALSDGSGVGGLQFVLNYDSNVLSYPAGASPTAGNLIDGHSIVANGTTPGKVSIALASANSLKSGPGTVVLIPLMVSKDAVLGSKISLTLSNALAFDPTGGNVSLQTQSGTLMVAGSPPQKLYFAQFGNGSQSGSFILSEITIVSLVSTTAENATIEINNDAGNPLTVNLNGTVVPGRKDVLVPANGTVTLTTDGQGPIQSGSVVISSGVKVAGVILFGGSVGLAGVGDSKPLKRFIAPMKTARGTNSGVAMMGLGQDQNIQLELRNQQGTLVARAGVFLGAKAHVAKFVTEFPWDTPLDFSNFSGTLTATGTTDFAATVILVRPGEFATLPVTERD